MEYLVVWTAAEQLKALHASLLVDRRERPARL